MVDFGNVLKTLRLKENFTQAQLAQKLGLTKSVISAYETGLRLPSYDILIHIAKIFGVSTDYLLGLENKQEIDLSGLSQEEIDALLNLIRAMKKTKAHIPVLLQEYVPVLFLNLIFLHTPERYKTSDNKTHQPPREWDDREPGF